MQSVDSTHTVLVYCTIDAISNLNDACQLHEYSREAKWLLNERLLPILSISLGLNVTCTISHS
jgi:hypothetical protein